MMEHILQLDEHDDIASIRGRIEYAFPPRPATADKVERRLLLMVPAKTEAMRSLVNMKVLARLAQKRAVKVAIATPDPVVRDYAKEAGFKLFGSLQAAKRAKWITLQAPIAYPDETLPPPATPVAEPRRKLPKPRKKYRVVEGSGRVNIFQLLGALILIVIFALALVVGVIALLPRATVTLTPVAQPLEARLVARASPELERVNFQELTFPARVDQVDLELSGEIETIETELAPVGRSAGFVTFINRTDEWQYLPISTTVSTSAGTPIRFRTAITTAIPPGSTSTTGTLVLAEEPGPRGNVAPGQINRIVDPSLALVARVINEQPFDGGSLQPARVVVNDDKERLREHLEALMLEEGLSQLRERLGEQEFIPRETVQLIVLDIRYREFSGDVSEVFGGELQGVVRGTVVGGYNANRLALAALEAEVPPGYELELEGLQFGAGEVLEVDSQGYVSFRIYAEGRAVREINRDDVASQISGLPIGEAQAVLASQYELAAPPGVELNPPWLVEWIGRLPFIPFRIDVVVNDSVTLMAEGGDTE